MTQTRRPCFRVGEIMTHNVMGGYRGIIRTNVDQHALYRTVFELRARVAFTHPGGGIEQQQRAVERRCHRVVRAVRDRAHTSLPARP